MKQAKRAGGDSGISSQELPPLPWTLSLQVEVESAGDDESDAAAVEAKLEGLRKGGAQLRVVADRGLQVGRVGAQQGRARARLL